MLDHASPMRALAMRQMVEEFGDLLSVRAKVTLFEQSLVEATFEQIFFERSVKDEWHRRVRAAFDMLDKGHLESPVSVATHYLNTANQIAATLNSAMSAKNDLAELTNDAEAEMRGALAYYKQLVEGPYRVLLAPIAFAFSKKMKSGDKDLMPQKDGKASLAALAKIERYSIHPQSQLKIGFDSHLRNAYAHEKYQILDDYKVRIWDENPRSGKVWGPEIRTLETINETTKQLELTIKAFTLAIAIYGINVRAFMTERNIRPTIAPPKIVFRDLEASIRHFASLQGFEVNELTRVNKEIHLGFETQLKGVDQESKIVMGGKGWGRQFKQPIKYYEEPVIAMLFDFLRNVWATLEDYDAVAIKVVSPADETIGAFEFMVGDIPKLQGPKTLPVAEARKLARVDTIGDATMFVRREGLVSGG